MGLRLTEHDGLPNTVIELGLMGRQSLCNAGTPASIPFDRNDVKNIAETIKQRIKDLDGEINYGNQTDIAKQMRDFVNIGDEWLQEEFYNE
jgi:hypothetical protein